MSTNGRVLILKLEKKQIEAGKSCGSSLDCFDSLMRAFGKQDFVSFYATVHRTDTSKRTPLHDSIRGRWESYKRSLNVAVGNRGQIFFHLTRNPADLE